MVNQVLPYQHEEQCPVEIALDMVGGKWKSLIIYYLLPGTMRFNQLRRAIPGATQQMLTRQLRELEQDGIIHREVYAQVPPKVEYSLTASGRSLGPVLEQMGQWACMHRQQWNTQDAVIEAETS
ncbi:MAG: transcriptional regulator [Chloroflexi bacterium AL-W]|nr:transcriptional regulator [Chloroflexi bacterium AL-N1]NOK64692.1 transcriptional regulator [Chloroflexi bacterium AL-N10]NOK75933.1 transcriptional regulator [Chloroflexi bacterium AL-N5]NOK80308.1 transcriptional regulator [Chloroflexi bacterium AL-W]NOK86821.1 transcriptional regulator [Chloroflexi bacterium AL-N15]